MKERTRPALLAGLAAGLAVQASIAVRCLSWYEALILFAITGIILVRPQLAAGLLLATVSLDEVRPLLGGVLVESSELLLAASANALLVALVRQRQRIDWRPLYWALPFLSAVLVSGLFNIQPAAVLPHVFRNAELAIAMWLAFNTARWPDAGPFFFYLAVPAALTLSCLVGWLPAFDPNSSVQPFSSFFVNPNQFAGYLSCLLPLVIACCIHSRKSLLPWLLLTLGAATLVGTASRAGLVATLAGLFVAVAAIRRRSATRRTAGSQQEPHRPAFGRDRRLIWAVALLLLVVITSSGVAYLTNLNYLFSLKQDPAYIKMTLEMRLLQFRTGLGMWKSSPWCGIGPGRYDDLIPAYLAPLQTGFREAGRRFLERYPGEEEWRARMVENHARQFSQATRIHLHNLYLQLLVDYGMLGLLGFLAFEVFVLVRLWRASSQSVWAGAGLGLLAGFLVFNLVDVTFPSLAIEVGLLLGAAASQDQISRKGVKTQS